MLSLHLIRHTSVAVGKGICYGQSDVALASSFDSESETVLQRLGNPEYSHVYSSPLSRCLQLAKCLQAAQLHEDSRLMELDFGRWELQSWDEIDRQELDLWAADFANHPVPGGESMLLMSQRVDAFLLELLQTHTGADQPIAVVTHAGVLRLITTRILGIPLVNVFRLTLDYGAIFELYLHEDPAHCRLKPWC